MSEDWRVTVSLREEAHAGRLLAALHAHTVEADTRTRLGKRVAVSGSNGNVFIYADSESAAREAEGVVSQVLSADALEGDLKLDRWHHEEERWEDASVSLPATPQEKQAEHERLEQEETSESQASGVAEWEVRVELASHHDAIALAERLQQEGLDVVRRWTFLVVGANDEDDARALAERLKDEMPAGAKIHVEVGGGVVWQSMPRNSFAVFGGLAG